MTAETSAMTEPNMTASTTYKLTTPELQAALRVAGLPPAAGSPLTDVPPPGAIAPQTLALLQQESVLQGSGVAEEWRRALTTLTVPAYHMSLYLGAADSWLGIDYYADRNGLVGYSRDGSNHSITFPCAPSRITTLLAEWLNLKAAAEVPRFQVNLSADELIAVAAIADGVREAQLRAFLGRVTTDARSFSREQLVYEVEAAAAPDPRWFSSLLKLQAPAPFQPNTNGLIAGVQALASRGWLTFEGQSVAPTETLVQVSTLLSSLSPHVRLDVGPAAQTGSRILILCALGSYCTMEFLTGDQGQPWVLFQSIGGSDMRGLMDALIGQLPALTPVPAAPSWNPPAPPPRAPAPVQPPPPRAVAPPPKAAPPPAQPVAKPVAPAAPLPKVCKKCSKPLTPGRKFCTGCGAPA